VISVYGLKNCDTCRKALNWLETRGYACQFHDFRTEGVNETHLRRWVEEMGWEKVLNKQSTTWRSLPESDKAGLDAERAIGLMMRHAALIKRPVFENHGKVVVGFREPQRAELERLGG
jgi:Spx/MgsR family transcriptional regulator